MRSSVDPTCLSQAAPPIHATSVMATSSRHSRAKTPTATASSPTRSRNGAVAAICERAPEGDWPGKTIVVAPDATHAVGELAHEWRQAWGGPVVGITGTVGKTTAKELIAAALASRFDTHKSEGNFNSRRACRSRS